MDHLRGTTEANDTYSKVVAADLKELVCKWRTTAQSAATPTVAPEVDEATDQPSLKKQTCLVASLATSLNSSTS